MDMDMDSSVRVRAVEKLLRYTFKNKKLLEEALTHSSCIDSASYERLEFFGDAVLRFAISKYLFFSYPEIDTGKLTDLRRDNSNNDTLARVAVRRGLYSYVRRRNLAVVDDNVRNFTDAVRQEDDTKVDDGDVKAPKILADIVESLAAAVYVDCEYDLNTFWEVFRQFLEPIVTPDVPQQQPQPVNQKEKAKLHAAKVAEQKLCPKPRYRWLTDQSNPPGEEPNVIHEAQVGWRSTMLMIARCGCNVLLYGALFFLLFVLFIEIGPLE